jgi:adenylate cyclase
MGNIAPANHTLLIGTQTLDNGGIGTPYLPQDQSEQRTAGLHPVIPRFIDPGLERRYRDQRLEFRLNSLRVVAFAGVLIWVLFTLLNSFTVRDPSQLLLFVRITAIVYTVVIFAATVLVKPGRWIYPVGFLGFAVQVPLLTCVLAFMSTLSLPYYPPTAIFMMLGALSFAVGLSFLEGLGIALCTTSAFFISVLVLWPEPSLLVIFHFAWLVTVIAFAGVNSYLLDRTQRIAWLQEKRLLHAEGQIRNLLHNVLPPSIAARKLAGESPIADRFAEASLLFADVVDFTSLSARLDSAQVVSMLGELFSRFDRIVAQHGLEKIKTIGDCYMVAAGIPQPLPGHLKKLAQAAVQMLEETSKARAPDGSPIMIRIGIHTGPVTAGVIGEAKFIFDVWGDTVNTASRMESHGAPGHIQVTEAVRAALLDVYHFAGPNIIEVKGKGPTQVWFLGKPKYPADEVI